MVSAIVSDRFSDGDEDIVARIIIIMMMIKKMIIAEREILN